MKRKSFNLSLFGSICLLSLGVVGLTACNGNAAPAAPQVRTDVSEISINVGETKKLKVSVTKTFKDADVYWVSTNTNVAMVKDGYVYGVGQGECEVHCYIGGGRSVCKVTVTGGSVIDTPTLILLPKSKEIEVNATFKYSPTLYPSDTTVTYSSSNESVARVAGDGTVTGVSEGTAVITAIGSNDKTDTATVKVKSSGGGGGGGEEQYGYTGKFTVGAPLKQQEWTQQILQDFNTRTGSSINFTVIPWEEDKAADTMVDVKSGPDVYPYASDQTLRLYALNALQQVGNSDVKWINDNMGETAVNYATLSGIDEVVGYPFAADNGYVMFYDKSVVSDPSEIDTIDKLIAKATAEGREIDFDLTNGFYATGTLMTYAEGKSLYTLKAKASGSYSASSTFNSDKGIAAAKAMKKIFNNYGYGPGKIVGASEAPGATNEVLATITDTSKVAAFKQALGPNYGATALPYVTEGGPRLGVYLGYKFYGVNPQKGDSQHTKIACDIAKFLCNDYAEASRFNKFYTQPTLTSLQGLAANEEHVSALNIQKQANGCVPLTAVDVALWDKCASAATDIKKLVSTTPADSEYIAILDELDTGLYKK